MIFKTRLDLMIIILISFTILIILLFYNQPMKTSNLGVTLQKFKLTGNTNDEIDELKKSVVINLHRRLYKSESKVFSQNGEDGVISELIKILDLDKNKTFVEIGTQSGTECNSRYAREKLGWKVHMFDGGFEDPDINLHKEVITHQNVIEVLSKYPIGDDIEILSEDTDYADYWIIESILGKYSPKILLHEINQEPPENCVTTPKSDSLIFWDGTEFHGASVCAFRCLAIRFKYTMVYCEKRGINCFWIRNDLLESVFKVEADFFQKILTAEFLFQKGNPHPKSDKKWQFLKPC